MCHYFHHPPTCMSSQSRSVVHRYPRPVLFFYDSIHNRPHAKMRCQIIALLHTISTKWLHVHSMNESVRHQVVHCCCWLGCGSKYRIFSSDNPVMMMKLALDVVISSHLTLLPVTPLSVWWQRQKSEIFLCIWLDTLLGEHITSLLTYFAELSCRAENVLSPQIISRHSARFAFRSRMPALVTVRCCHSAAVHI